MVFKLDQESFQSEPQAGHAGPQAGSEAAPQQASSPANAPRASQATTVRNWRRLAMQREVIVLLAMVLFNLIFTPHFWSLQTFNVNLTQVVTIVIVGIGMTLVVATGGIDLSVGASMAISGALAPMLFLNIPGPGGIALAFVLPVLAAALCGVFNGLLVTRLAVQPIVATLVLFIAGRGIAQVVTDGSLQAFNTPAFQWIALGKVAGVPFQVLLMLALVVAFAWVVRKTLFGQYLLITGGNEKAAYLSGVPTASVKLIAYTLCAALAGLAGLISISVNSSSDANVVGLGIELDAIAAVAVGGTALTGGKAFIGGTLVGALIIQLLRYTLLAHGIPDAAALVVKAGIIVAAVYVQRRSR
jgi:ribose transport system permease protein